MRSRIQLVTNTFHSFHSFHSFHGLRVDSEHFISVSSCEIPQRISGAKVANWSWSRRVCVRPSMSVRPSEVSIIVVVSIGRKLQSSPHGVFQPRLDEMYKTPSRHQRLQQKLLIKGVFWKDVFKKAWLLREWRDGSCRCNLHILHDTYLNREV